MKRLIGFSLVVLVFAFLAFGQDANTTVYVTKSGSCYHNAGCSSLKKSSIPMKLGEASRRYSPCSRCKPPVLGQISTQSPMERSSVGDTAASAAKSQSRDSRPAVGTTSKGETIYEGPRGGHYHYSPSGKKVYEKRKK